MYNRILRLITLMVFGSVIMCAGVSTAGESLLVFAGAASKPPLEESKKAFERKTGVKVDLVLGGSGYVLSQSIIGKQGDIYSPVRPIIWSLPKRKMLYFLKQKRSLSISCLLLMCRKETPRA